jgi:2-phosphoglycolate phosphatase
MNKNLKNTIQAVLFDLDGTILDTSKDLGSALNRLLAVRKLPPLAHEVMRPIVGRGAKGMLKLGLDINDDHPDFLTLSDELLEFYFQTVCESTDFFPGVQEVLQHLTDKNIPWGIVTNKPKRFTTLIADHLKLTDWAQCIISGDTLANAKPHPEPMLHACKLLGTEPANCIYVGDAEIDVQASKAAGIPVLTALYGFIAVDEKPEEWDADGYILQPQDILAYLT